MSEATQPSRVLICDDEKNMRRVLEDILADDGWAVSTAASGEELLTRLEKREEPEPEAIVLDLSLPGINGLEVLDKLQTLGVTAGVVVITAYGSVDAAVRAMQRGAVDFLIKPFDNARIRLALRRIRESGGLMQEAAKTVPLFHRPAKGGALEIVGSHPAVADVLTKLRKVAPLVTPILIQGESGTGKELVARAIHHNSPRRSHPFVSVNLGALPDGMIETELFGDQRSASQPEAGRSLGKLELASGGTLFIEEIAEAPASIQHQLLQFLTHGTFRRNGGGREQQVDVRIIASSQRDLRQAVSRRVFREDLYYALSVVALTLPPLRERIADLPALTQYYLQRFSQRHQLPLVKLSAVHLEKLSAHHWPGNVRELINRMEKVTILQDPDSLLNLSEPIAMHSPMESEHPIDDCYSVRLGEQGTVRALNDVAAEAERAAVLRAIRVCGGNKSEAAKALGVSYKTLFNKLDTGNGGGAT